jgi:hypothetical protein
VNWWKQLKQRWDRLTEDPQAAAIREAREKQLAEWAAGQHDADPIHK